MAYQRKSRRQLPLFPVPFDPCTVERRRCRPVTACRLPEDNRQSAHFIPADG